MGKQEKAVAKTYKDAYSGKDGSKARVSDRFSALDDRSFGGSFKKGKKTATGQEYRDLRSGKVFYVNKRGEIIRGSGEKDTSRFANEIEQRVISSVDKKLNMDFEREQTALGNRPYDPDAGKSLKEQLTSQGIAEGKNVKDASEAALQVEREDRIAYKIKKDLEGAQGYADPDDVARRTASLTGGSSPLPRMSPLYRRFVNPYGGNYADLSERVGSSVQGAVDELSAAEDRRAQKEKEARQAEREQFADQMTQVKWGQMMADEQSKLYVEGESGVPTVDDAIFSASRSLVDTAGGLVSDLKNGKRINPETGEEEDYGADQYAQDYAKVQGQVASLKNFKKNIEPMATAYNEMAGTGTVSKAMDPEAIGFWNSLTMPGADIDVGMLEDGVSMGIVGVSQDGNPVKIPLDQLDKMPRPIAAAPSAGAVLAPAMEKLSKLKRWDDKAGKAHAAEALDAYIGQAGPNGLKALAMDQFKYDAEDMAAEFGSPGDEGYVNKLEEEMERRLAIRAQELFIKDQYSAYQLETLKLQKQKILDQAKQDGNTTDLQRKLALTTQKAKIDREAFEAAKEMGNYSPLYGTEVAGKELTYAGLGSASAYNLGRSMKDKYVAVSGKDIVAFNTQDELDMYLQSGMKLQYQQQQPGTQKQGTGKTADDYLNPVKRVSPLQRNSPFKERPPTKEEYDAIVKAGKQHYLPGYSDYNQKKFLKASKEQQSSPDFQGIYDPELIKSVHLPGTVPTSDAERSSLYENARIFSNWAEKSDENRNTLLSYPEARGAKTIPEAIHNIGLDMAKKGNAPNEHVERALASIKYKNPYKK